MVQRKTSNHNLITAAAVVSALAPSSGCELFKDKSEGPSKGIAYRKAAPTEPQPVSTSARIADAYSTIAGTSPTQTADARQNLETAVQAIISRKVNNSNVTEIMTKTSELARLFNELEGTPLALPQTQTAQVLGKHEQDIFNRMNVVLGATSSTQTAAVTTTGTARWNVLEKVADIATRYNSIATARALNDGRVTLDVKLGNTWAAQWAFTPVTTSAVYAVQNVEMRQRSATETAVFEPGVDLMKAADGTVVKLDAKTWKTYAAKTEAERQAVNEFASGATGTTQTARLSLRTIEGYDAKDATKRNNTYMLIGTSLVRLSDRYGRQELDGILQKYAALEQNDTTVLATLHKKGLISDAQLRAAEDYRTRADRDFGKMLESADPATLTAELQRYFATYEGKGAYGRIGVTFVEGRQVRELGLTSATNPQTYFDAEIALGEHLSELGTTLTARILAESDERVKGGVYFTPGDNLELNRRTEVLPTATAEALMNAGKIKGRNGKPLRGWHKANPHQLNPTTWSALKDKTFHIQGYQTYTNDGKR